MPCLITALSELNEPRYMTPGGIFDAFDKEVTAVSYTHLDVYKRQEYQMLRTSALNIINELQITGGCNVQYLSLIHS